MSIVGGGKKMTFNRECRHFDFTKMDSDRIERGTMNRTEIIIRPKFPCLAKEDEEWIYKWPDNCPLFEER